MAAIPPFAFRAYKGKAAPTSHAYGKLIAKAPLTGGYKGYMALFVSNKKYTIVTKVSDFQPIALPVIKITKMEAEGNTFRYDTDVSKGPAAFMVVVGKDRAEGTFSTTDEHIYQAFWESGTEVKESIFDLNSLPFGILKQIMGGKKQTSYGDLVVKLTFTDGKGNMSLYSKKSFSGKVNYKVVVARTGQEKIVLPVKNQFQIGSQNEYYTWRGGDAMAPPAAYLSVNLTDNTQTVGAFYEKVGVSYEAKVLEEAQSGPPFMLYLPQSRAIIRERYFYRGRFR